MARARIGVARAMTAAVVLIVAGQAGAADIGQAASVPQAEAWVAEAPSPWQIRLRALGVITEDSGYVNAVPGSGLSYSNTVTPELDISYFFTDNIAAELILGTTYANIGGQGAIGGLGKVGKVWLLPPTVTLQYHFTDFGAFEPYLGAGVNYTIFYHQQAGSADDLKVKNTFGAALQVGFDYMRRTGTKRPSVPAPTGSMSPGGTTRTCRSARDRIPAGH